VGLALNFYSEGWVQWKGVSVWVVGGMIVIWVLILFGITFYVCYYRKNKDKTPTEPSVWSLEHQLNKGSDEGA